MRIEEIVVLALIFLTAICIWVLMYQVWKYLNSKSLGMQTVLDELIKEGIIILGTALLVTWIMWIKVVTQYNYYAAMTIAWIVLFVRVSVLAQPGVFAIVKYQMVFHFDFINSIDDEKIKMMSRAFVFTLALVCNIVMDFENTLEFLYLKEIQLDETFDVRRAKPDFVVLIISVLVIGFVQGRIVYERWKNPLPQQQESQNGEEKYNLKVISFVCMIFLIESVILISLLSIKLFALGQMLNILGFYIMLFTSIMLTVYSNKKMYLYVKKQFINQPSQIHPEPVTQQDIDPENPDPSQNANQIPLQDLGQNQDQPNEDQNQLPNVSPQLPEPQASNSCATISAYLYHRIEPDLPEIVIY